MLASLVSSITTWRTPAAVTTDFATWHWWLTRAFVFLASRRCGRRGCLAWRLLPAACRPSTAATAPPQRGVSGWRAAGLRWRVWGRRCRRCTPTAPPPPPVRPQRMLWRGWWCRGGRGGAAQEVRVVFAVLGAVRRVTLPALSVTSTTCTAPHHHRRPCPRWVARTSSVVSKPSGSGNSVPDGQSQHPVLDGAALEEHQRRPRTAVDVTTGPEQALLVLRDVRQQPLAGLGLSRDRLARQPSQPFALRRRRRAGADRRLQRLVERVQPRVGGSGGSADLLGALLGRHVRRRGAGGSGLKCRANCSPCT